ncbi:MAG: zinc-ribbon domain-containing protein, partial [Bifidobacteriaceae bacterium]|nr:zinc-ribbon domain-containing protein [Bifidobacteriaceae bacterium]
MTCPNCGASAAPGVPYCPNCGQPVAAPSEAPPPAYAPPPQQAAPPYAPQGYPGYAAP